jgi:hypothetical protein
MTWHSTLGDRAELSMAAGVGVEAGRAGSRRMHSSSLWVLQSQGNGGGPRIEAPIDQETTGLMGDGGSHRSWSSVGGLGPGSWIPGYRGCGRRSLPICWLQDRPFSKPVVLPVKWTERPSDLSSASQLLLLSSDQPA